MENILIELIPSDFALERKILPLKLQDNIMDIGMPATDDLELIQDLRLLTGRNIHPVQMPVNEVLAGISALYNIKISAQRKNGSSRQYSVFFGAQDAQTYHSGTEDESSVINEINSIISTAINQNASDIHFEAYENRFRIRYRIDGRLHEVKSFPSSRRFAFISRLKIMSELDIAEKRRPQDGRIRMQGGDKIVDIRVSSIPTDFGEKVVLRLLDKSSFKLDIDNIGFTEEMQERFKHVLKLPYGMILITGPTGSGKTTTLYTALSEINKTDINIMTIEDPIEYNLDGINQSHVRPDIGYTFPNALRSFLRQDPDVIMVGEIRDSETAEIAIRSALTGHLVLSTLHTNDAPSAITRLIDMKIEPFLVSSSVKMIIAQRLVRRICPECKETYEPDPALVKLLTLDNDHEMQFFRGKGCDECNGTGYQGRTALLEMFSVTEKISELILSNVNASRLRKAAIIEGMLSLRDHGILKIHQGETTLEEVVRETMI